MFNFQESLRSAEARLSRPAGRQRRSDAGRSRLPPPVLAIVREAAATHERPSVASLRRRLAEACAAHGVRPPSRATLYTVFDRLEGNVYQMSALPPAIASCLHNLGPGDTVPGRQLVFACLNYGALPALSFAAGLPWIDLHQARQLRGWRPRSRGLLSAILRRRARR